jgi:hypothetical protein
MMGWWDNLEETQSPVKKKRAEVDDQEIAFVRKHWE